MSHKRGILFIIAFLLNSGCTQTGTSQGHNLTLCGASPSGLWSLLGTGLDSAMKVSFPDSTITYQTSGGGFANVRGLQEARCDIALVHDAEATIAKNGALPFTQAHTNLRTIAVLYNWAPLQFIVSKAFAEEYNVASLEEIIEKKAPLRVLLNRRGNISSQVGEAMINAAGASLEDISSWGGSVTFAASEEQGDLMRDRRANAILNSLFVGHSSILQIADAIDVVLLPISADTANKVAEQFGIIPFNIPRQAYEWSDSDVLTVSLSAHLFALEDYSDEIIEELTTAIIQNLDKLKLVHNAMVPLDIDLMASSNTIPYHEAAIRAFVSAGYMK
jgi:uncharacterized protein